MKAKIVCDYRRHFPAGGQSRSADFTVNLSLDAKFGNVYLEPALIAQAIGSPLDCVSRDLCEIAAYVYMADKAVPRGRYEKWTRDLAFLVPVGDPDRWNSVKEILTNTVGTLSGDNVAFQFVSKVSRKESTARSLLSESRAMPKSDCSCLFSGGLDSFAGAAYLVQEQRRQPLFASHYVSGLKNVQSGLIGAIQREFGRTFHHFQYRVTSRRSKQTRFPYQAKESSHRARSFLFLSFATVAAALRGLSDIFICENGVLSLNVPISDARKGSRSTRHAHPLYLFYFNQLIDALYERKFNLTNPFLFWTKGEEAAFLRGTNLYPLIKGTVTCWGYPNQTLQYDCNHCGYCLPCIVRRVSLIATGLERYDDCYVVDVFGPGEKLSEKQQRNVEDLAYFCHCFAMMSKTELVYRYPELVMVETGASGSSGDGMGKIIRVYKKFAEEFLAVAERLKPGLVEATLREASVSR